MLKQVELFATVNQIPANGLKTQKEQAVDPLEGLRRKEEVRQDLEQWLFKIGV